MATAAELTVAEELVPLREQAGWVGWTLKEFSPLRFLLGLPASDGTRFYLSVTCDDYPIKPPAWHWCDEDGGALDMPNCTPSGSGFFHPNGVICAPWNCLAYTNLDPRGPHGDWTIGDWKANSYTKGCTTLCAMALRLYVELNSCRYDKKRKG
jgi:hypothetical protein